MPKRPKCAHCGSALKRLYRQRRTAGVLSQPTAPYWECEPCGTIYDAQTLEEYARTRVRATPPDTTD